MTLNRRQFMQQSALAMGAIAGQSAFAQGSQKPNIVLIMADDLGYGDIGCFGNERIKTPRLDQLAKEGIRFTDFHSNGAVCTPTRAALLTGRYQQRSGLEGVIYVRGNTREIGIDPDEYTIADGLKQAGYATGCFGKWHLGYKKKHNPVHLGFDEFRGYVSGNIDFHSHVDNAGIPDWWHNDEQVHEEGYVTELITDHAIDFIQDNQNQPFFCYIAHEAPHWPYQGPTDPADRYPGVKFDSRGSRDDYADAYKEMVESMDSNIGRVIDGLERLGLQNNTLVLFCSDNGGVNELGDNGGYRGNKGSLWEGGHRVPAIAYWPGMIDAGQECSETILSMDWMPTMLSLANQPLKPEHFDGVDCSDLLLKNQSLKTRPVFWRYRDQKAARHGEWKLLLDGDTPYLFNLEKDPYEQNNLSDTQPAIKARLMKLLTDWEKEMDKVKQKTT